MYIIDCLLVYFWYHFFVYLIEQWLGPLLIIYIYIQLECLPCKFLQISCVKYLVWNNQFALKWFIILFMESHIYFKETFLDIFCLWAFLCSSDRSCGERIYTTLFVLNTPVLAVSHKELVRIKWNFQYQDETHILPVWVTWLEMQIGRILSFSDVKKIFHRHKH